MQRLPYRNISAVLTIFLYLFISAPGVRSDPATLLTHFPDASEMKHWEWSSSPQQFELMQLFAVINGEAERYMRHGCIRAAFGTYKTSDGLFVDVQLFLMKDRRSAKRVFEEKSDPGGEHLPIGEEAIFEGYYLNFRSGDYL